MQTLLPNSDSQSSHPRNGWGFCALALLLLSFGIGATTAAFSVIDAMLPHSAAYPSCNAAFEYADDTIHVLGNGQFDAYQSSMAATGDGLSSWVDDAGGIADVAVALMIGTAALALLVACADSAPALHERSGHALERSVAVRAAFTTVGALTVAAVLVRAMSSSSLADVLGSMAAARLDIRAIAFAACVSAAVEARRQLRSRITNRPSSARP